MVARMQADRWLVEHEQRVDHDVPSAVVRLMRLDLAPDSVRLWTIEREISDSDIDQERSRARNSSSSISEASSRGAGNAIAPKKALTRSIGNSIKSCNDNRQRVEFAAAATRRAPDGARVATVARHGGLGLRLCTDSHSVASGRIGLPGTPGMGYDAGSARAARGCASL